MGKIKAEVQEFLDNGGYTLGYDVPNLPTLSDLKYVLDNQVDADTYWNDKISNNKGEGNG